MRWIAIGDSMNVNGSVDNKMVDTQTGGANPDRFRPGSPPPQICAKVERARHARPLIPDDQCHVSDATLQRDVAPWITLS